MKRLLLLVCAWISCALGFLGIAVPVLPTTPFLLLATFLFAKSSPRLHRWICSTRVYRSYVVPFKEAGGIPLGSKVRILAVSYALMGASAWFAQKPLVWAILGCAALFLLYLLVMRIPTVKAQQPAPLRAIEAEPAE